MPSAEKTSSAAVKLESIQQNETKMMENVQKESSAESGTTLFALNQIVSMISNKVRNLEKRKNKLDGYKKEEDDGRELSLEQQKAISKYDEVIQQLALAKDLSKQIGETARNANKDAKREARNAVFSRQLQEKTKVRDVLMLQDLLQRLKDANVRADFLAQRNGACLVSKEEMHFIDEFAAKAVPQRPSTTAEQTFENSSKAAAEYFCFVVDGRNKAFGETGMTYEKARDLFGRIQACGYWEKDVKVVERSADESSNVESGVSRADTETPNSEDMPMVTTKENQPADTRVRQQQQQQQQQQAIYVARQPMLPVNPPAANQVPTPAFNGVQHQQQQVTMARMSQQQQQQQAQLNMKTTVSAVESQYFNQMKLSHQQQQMGKPMQQQQQPPAPSDFSSTFSFLQDSELEVPQKKQQQPSQKQQQGSHSQPPQKQKPVNVIQHSPVQPTQPHQVNSTAPTPSNYPPSQMYPPPGLKVQQPHIPVNYQKQQQQQSSQVPPHMIPKQVASIEQQQQSSRPAYPPALVPGQVQTFANCKSIEQQLLHQHQSPIMKSNNDAGGMDNNSSNSMTTSHRDEHKSKEHDDYQQQPQIGTWSNETATQSANGHGNMNFASRTGGFSRNHRGSGGEKKFSNYRNPRGGQENGGGDLQPQQQSQPSGGTFFRNNDQRFNNAGANNGNGRYENRGGSTGHPSGAYKPREGNHRAGSGRFPASNAALQSHAAVPRK